MGSLAVEGSRAAARPDANDRHPWSLRLGRVLGIPIDLHVTFLVLLAWIALAPLAEGVALEKGLGSAAFTLLVFGTVVLHELGHAVVARRFGFETTRILLLPIGGIASLAKMPTRPREELAVAIAGPAVNVSLALALAAFLVLSGGSLDFTGQLDDGPLAVRLLWVNVGLAGFNLLPAFPMDGGRALRALLAMVLDRPRATAIATLVGRGLALVLGVLGLAFQPMLALIALFVWSASRMENGVEQMHAALAGVRVQRVMTRHVDVVDAVTPLLRVAEHLLGDHPHDVVVVQDERVVGLLTRSTILRALARGEGETPVSELMRRDLVTASPEEPLEDALARLERSGLVTLVVLEGARVVGIVDATTLGDLLVLDRAVRASGSAKTASA